ncbi:MAG TPA: family 1 glycosylhydrolase [Candidatus Acidoferrales bacterium]|nr:family 1 glycosylhydrolase [Candidatus Acidoferrales bacterium]
MIDLPPGRALGKLGLRLFAMVCAVFAPTLAHADIACPATATVPPDFQWGLVAYHVNFPGYELQADDLDRMAANGIRWIRIDFAWGRIEPEQGGAFDFNYFDTLVAAAKAHGIHIAGTLGNGYNTRVRPVAPLWTQKLSGPQYVAALARYADAVTERYADDVDIWALENELHIAALHVALQWRHRIYPPAINQEILRTLSQAVDRRDPTAQIVLTLTPSFPAWQRFVKESTQRFRFDAIGLYTYPSFNAGAPPVGFEDLVADQIADAKDAAPGREVLIFETGYQTPPDKPKTPEDEGALLLENQAIYIETMVRSAIDGGAKGVYFYQYLDNPDELIPREEVFGLVTPDRAPKPAWGRYGDVIAACSAP